jgi:acetylornithine deacetylase
VKWVTWAQVGVDRMACAWLIKKYIDSAGIPTVVFGPGGHGAHATVEWVDLEQVKQYSEALLATAEEFCSI